MIGGGSRLRAPASYSKVLQRRQSAKEEAPSPPIPSMISVPPDVDVALRPPPPAAAAAAIDDEPTNSGNEFSLLPPPFLRHDCRRSASCAPVPTEIAQGSPELVDAAAHCGSGSLNALSYGFFGDDDSETDNYGAEGTDPRAITSTTSRPSSYNSSGDSFGSSTSSPRIHKDSLLASVRSMASSEAVHEEMKRILALPVGAATSGQRPTLPSKDPAPSGTKSVPDELSLRKSLAEAETGVSLKDLFLARPLYPAISRPPQLVGVNPPRNDGWEGARAG